MRRLKKKLLRTLFDHDPDYYDMYADRNERAFADIYIHHITRHLEEKGIEPPASLMDAGCQTGRLMLPLAAQGYRMSGIDRSGFALRKAKRHAREAGVKLDLKRGDLLNVLNADKSSIFDAIICAEVIYLIPEYRKLLTLMKRRLSSRGLLCVSHRTPYFYWLDAMRRGDEKAAEKALRHREGPQPGGEYFNWQDSGDLRALYTELGMTIEGIHPIDRVAWLSGLVPAEMDTEEFEFWKRFETEEPGLERWSKYLLVVASTMETN